MNKDELTLMLKRGKLGIKYLIKRLGADYNQNDFKVLALFEDIMIELSDAHQESINRKVMYNKILKKLKGVNDEHLRESANSTITVAFPTT
jgi:hypothetical protein